MKKISKKKIVLISIAALLVILIAGMGIYVSDYYRSEEIVKEYYNEKDKVKVEKTDTALFLDGPGEKNALIFYPGAKVEYDAYMPLLHTIAMNGTDVFIVKMPCNLAILGKNKADTIIKDYNYDNWYMAGHSLGGAMAADYCANHTGKIKGLALLAAYPTKDLKKDDFFVVSIYGSKDGVLNMEKLEKGKQYMPDNYTQVCIQGGNHAQFGNYGIQKKDGTADISYSRQQEQTSQAILKMIEESIK